jgi:chromosome segregation ATPase
MISDSQAHQDENKDFEAEGPKSSVSEKPIELEVLLKRNAFLEESAKSARLEMQETLLKNSLLVAEKEKLYEVVKAQMVELDNLKCEQSQLEITTKLLEETQKENEELKQQIHVLTEKLLLVTGENKEEEFTTPVYCDHKNDITEQLSRRIVEVQTGNTELELEAFRLKTQTDEDKSRLNASHSLLKDFFTRITELEEQMQALQLQSNINNNVVTRPCPLNQSSVSPKKIIITEIKNMETTVFP